MTLAELRALLDEEEAAEADSAHVSTIDASPPPGFVKQSAQEKKPAAAGSAEVNTDRCSVLKELGSAVKLYKQRLSNPTPSLSEKRAAPEPEDDVSLLAHQCEPKNAKFQTHFSVRTSWTTYLSS